MGAIKGRPAAREAPAVISVESAAVYAQKIHRRYKVIITVVVDADSPAEAVALMQNTMLGETDGS